MKWTTVTAANQILSREQGSVTKDWGGRLPIALIYPNTYYVGMSSLAVHTLYRMLNAEPDVVCERVFHGHRRLDRNSVPISLETQRPLPEFGLLAATLSFELDYLNLVMMLRNAGMPALAADRDETWPLLLAGGPAVSANPEPLAELCDAFVIGEVEEILPFLLEALRDGLLGGKEAALQNLALVPGVYIPLPAGDPLPVQRQWVKNLDAYPTHTSVFTRATRFGGMYLTEIGRGCARGCRFCLAGRIYRPRRERTAAMLLEHIRRGRPPRFKVGLISAAVSDYSQTEELVCGLQDMGIKISVSSMRVDPLPESLLAAIAAGGTRTLTVAPEAGSQRLRSAIGKSIHREHILAAARRASDHGFPELKLYFMVGLPTEEQDDIQAIIELVRETSRVFPRRITVSVACFVPKAHTSFERQPMAPAPILRRHLRLIQTSLRSIGVRTTFESTPWAGVQAVLARGDRLLGPVLASLRSPTLAHWKQALKDHDLHSEQYTRARETSECLPWDFVDVSVSAQPTEDKQTAHDHTDGGRPARTPNDGHTPT
ncbi:MAG TPA: radical SAM protein [Anaerolineae bacterium]|nr:radical SAM protein [Anaerolineae bacterium]